MKMIQRKDSKVRRQLRSRKKIFGTQKRPRISVFRSNRYIYAQIIDDVEGRTLVDGQAYVKELHKDRSKMDAAFEVGKKLAEEAIGKDIKNAVFDRRSNKYHGRVKRLADGAREGGLEF